MVDGCRINTVGALYLRTGAIWRDFSFHNISILLRY